MKEIVVSGMRPTGKLHIGHLSVIKNWIKLQKNYQCYFFVADYHALTTKFDDTSNFRDYSLEMVKTWIAAGLDPDKATIFIQSQVPAHSELFLLLGMNTPLSWLERCPTYKGQIDAFKENEGKSISNYGFLGYPLLQACDILLYDGQRVPIGADQLPHLEITREIARRYNFLFKKDIFTEPEGILGKTSSVIGIDGRKMSKSYNNQIDIISSIEQITKAVKSMITDPKRVRKNDPGHPDICSVFSYHKEFQNEGINEIEQACIKGEIGCMDCKKILIEDLNRVLSPIVSRKNQLDDKEYEISEILEKGRVKACRVAGNKVGIVKNEMGL